MTAPATKQHASTMLTVLDEQGRCLGLLLRRGPAGVEGFNTADQSIGLFQNEDEAAAELWRRARGQLVSNERIAP
jgi:hypothetical protein